MYNRGVSPVIGVLIIIGLVVAAGALAVTVVFDASNTGTNGLATAALDVDYESELLIDVQLVKPVDGTVIVRTALGTEYELSQAGDSVDIPNQDGNLTPVAFIEKDGQRSVLREIPPQSFTPDVIVKKGDSPATKLSSLGDDDIAVIQQDEYTGNVDVADGTVVGEDGSVLRADTSETCTVNVENPAALVNLEVDADGQTQHSVCANHTTSEDTLLDGVRTSGATGDELAGPLRVGSAGGSSSDGSGGSTLLTWGSQADWDAAVSESGVAHEAVSNTDHDDAGVLQKGYSYSSFDAISASPIAAYPFHEDNGSTAFDVAGSNDASCNGPDFDVTGIIGTSGTSWNGTSDTCSPSDETIMDGLSEVTLAAWFYHDSQDGNLHRILAQISGSDFDDSTLFTYAGPGSSYQLHVINNGNYGDDRLDIGESNATPQEWHYLVGTFNGSGEMVLYLDGERKVSESTNAGSLPSPSGLMYGAIDDGTENWNGDLAGLRIYNTDVSDTDVQSLYDVAAAQSSLTTATKSFDSSTRPDLTDLNYSRNGGTIEVTVIGSPSGTTETKTVTLDGSSSVDLTWNNAHEKFRVKITLNHTDVTKTPTVRQIGLQGT